MRLARTVALACAVTVTATTATAAAAAAGAARPDKLFITGDSLVDAGNVWIASGFAIPPSSAGYFQGRFTNGPDWTDILNQRLYGSYTTPYLAGGTNYAVGGARGAGDAIVPNPAGGTATLPGLPAQVAWYVGQNGMTVDPNALYVISFGNNDASAIRDGQTYVTDENGNIVPLTEQAYVTTFATNIATTAGFALAGGARVFVGGVPKPGDPPSLELQAALDTALDPLSAVYGDRLIRFSYADFFTGVAANPASAGLYPNADFSSNCLAAGAAAGHPVNCRGYFSFDGTHPTAGVQRALANAIAPLIGAPVPEPASWTMLIAGFGVIGAGLRARKKATSAVLTAQ